MTGISGVRNVTLREMLLWEMAKSCMEVGQVLVTVSLTGLREKGSNRR